MGTTGRTPRWSVAAALCASMLVVAGCTDDEPTDDSGNDPTSQTPSPSPSGSESDAPVEPEVPDAMANVDKAGAKAFVQYYWDVVAFAQQSGNLSVLRELSAKSCKACNAGIEGVQKTLARAKTITGGQKSVSFGTIQTLAAEGVRTFEVNHTVKSTSQLVVLKSGDRERYTGSTTRYRIFAGRDDGRKWKVWRIEAPS